MARYIFDLDGTLCSNEKNVYNAKPYPERIRQVNILYAKGHIILIDSARGSITGKDHFKKTEAQLKEWGIHYHYLRTGVKYFGDVYIGDEAMSDKEFFKGIGQC